MDAISTPAGVRSGAGRRPGKRGQCRANAASPTIPPVAYERTPGVGSTPFPGTYRRHEPEKTILHGVIRDHLEMFLHEARAPDGEGYPSFAEHEFRRYLHCGLLCHGFARLRCAECGYERLVGFSCKGKLCPSQTEGRGPSRDFRPGGIGVVRARRKKCRPISRKGQGFRLTSPRNRP